MQLDQQFTIPTNLEHAYELLLDVEAVAPCFPGASIAEVDGDNVTGAVKVKLGPVLLTYNGKLRFVERDDEAHRVVMDGRGTDAKGNGTASAKVTAQLEADGESSTTCHLVTELNVTGRPAQFGRGMMLEVGNNILGKFSTNLAARLAEEQSAASTAVPEPTAGRTPEPAAARHVASTATSSAAPPVSSTSRPVPTASAEVEPLDLLQAARGAALKRLAPVAVVAILVMLALIWWLA